MCKIRDLSDSYVFFFNQCHSLVKMGTLRHWKQVLQYSLATGKWTCTPVPKLTMANTSKYNIKLCLDCCNIEHRLYCMLSLCQVTKKAAQLMIKWLTWLQLYCNQTVSFSFLTLVKTGKNQQAKVRKKKPSKNVFFFLVDIPQRSILNSRRPHSVATNRNQLNKLRVGWQILFKRSTVSTIAVLKCYFKNFK